MRRLEDKKVEKEFLDAYDQYAEAILRHAYLRVDSRVVAQDLTSETFTKTWQFIANGGKVKNFKSFLYRVCNNLIIDYYRSKAKTDISLEDVGEQAEPEGDSPFKNIDTEIAFATIKKHLDSLPHDYKQILIHRYIDELSILEIKEITGKSVTNIYTIINRSLKLLRKKYMKKKIEPKLILKKIKNVSFDVKFLQSLRKALIIYIKANPPIKRKARFGWFSLGPKTAPAMIIGLIVLLSGVGSVAASQDSLPGEVLYNVKLLSEKVEIVIISDPQAKTQMRFALAQKRINEMKELAEKIKIEQLASQQQKKALKISVVNFSENLSGIYDWADELRARGQFDEAIQINTNLKIAADIYQQIFVQTFINSSDERGEKTAIDMESETDGIIKEFKVISAWRERAMGEIEEINKSEFIGAQATGLGESAQNKINTAEKKVEIVEKIIEKKKGLEPEIYELSRQKLEAAKKILEDAKANYESGNYKNAFEEAQDLIKSLSGAKAFLEISPKIDTEIVNIFWRQEREQKDELEKRRLRNSKLQKEWKKEESKRREEIKKEEEEIKNEIKNSSENNGKVVEVLINLKI